MLTCLEADGTSSALRIRKEDGDLYYADNMDIGYDCCLFHCHVCRTHIRDRHRHGITDNIFQRSYRHCERSEQRSKPAIYKIPQLVFPGHHDVLFVWGECHILFQTYRAGGQGPLAFCDPSSVY